MLQGTKELLYTAFIDPYTDRKMVDSEKCGDRCTNADKVASKMGFGANFRFLSCGYTFLTPIGTAILIITALGMAGILPTTTVAYALIGLGAGVMVTNLLMGNFKNRPFSVLMMTAQSAAFIAIGVLGLYGLPIMTLGMAALIALYVGHYIHFCGYPYQGLANTFCCPDEDVKALMTT